MESRLIDCRHINNNAECQQDAGIVCCKYRALAPTGLQYTDKRSEETTCTTVTECATVPNEAEEHATCPPLECDCTCPSTEVTGYPTLGTMICPECDSTCPNMETTADTVREEHQKINTATSIALGGLGALAAVLIFILVGVVLG